MEKKQQQLNFESEYKGHKIGENPNLEFMKLSGISGSLKKFLCVFGFANLDIC